ncbi:MAG: prepilin-type N-terminal cleavage/methylation domain-containing protein [Verrucomicrobia bacterium]|nr:prepilin-type N-terminal cleavage/methylation domain-containing protein [Verrucomicrobiota bacterium]MDA1086200.1 prepilin-type N-terminal cleavage/methylation domain-containing protein [Verrucomicrobiota bacterium]
MRSTDRKDGQSSSLSYSLSNVESRHRRRLRLRQRRGLDSDCRGYTLLELMAVMLIVAIMMGTGFAGYYSAKQGVAMRSAVNTVRNGIASARGTAIARSRTITVVITSNAVHSYYTTGSLTTNVEQTDGNYLPPHVYLYEPGEGPPSDSPLANKKFRVYPDGSAGAFSNVVVDVREIGGPKGYRLTLHGLTGSVRTEDITL